MKANELRIGNFVKWAEDDSESPLVLTITGSLNGGDMWVEWVFDDGQKDDADCAIEEIAHIPLTEEWHNRFGVQMGAFRSFVYEYAVGKSIVFSGDYVYLINTERIDGQRGFGDDCCVLWSKDIKGRDMYVHEWQNLYFALTGQELKQKEG